MEERGWSAASRCRGRGLSRLGEQARGHRQGGRRQKRSVARGSWTLIYSVSSDAVTTEQLQSPQGCIPWIECLYGVVVHHSKVECYPKN